MPSRKSSPTATRIRYADIAEALGIRKASLHHHFATKAALGEALLARYRMVFLAALDEIHDATDDARERLERYAALYRSVLIKKRMCLCGMLATDAATLPKSMREGVAEFFAENQQWLAGVLEEGRASGQLSFEGPPDSLAMFVVSSLEGAMLVARSGASAGSFDQASERLLTVVGAKPARKRVPR
jgi:TetR/AcrR family transcriptional repressor of nem operon